MNREEVFPEKTTIKISKKKIYIYSFKNGEQTLSEPRLGFLFFCNKTCLCCVCLCLWACVCVTM